MSVQTSAADNESLVSPVQTAEDLARLPSGRARYELVRGELRAAPPAA